MTLGTQGDLKLLLTLKLQQAQTSINRVDERLAYYRFHLANKFGNARASELVREMVCI